MKRSYFVLFIALSLLITSCGKGKIEPKEKVKPIKVMITSEEITPKTLDYVGMVSSGEVKKVSFKSSSRIKNVLVQKGDSIKVGQALIELEKSDLEYALQAAQGRLTSAQAQYNKAVNGASAEDISTAELNVKKAQDVYNFANNTYEKARILYDGGAVSRNDLDKSKLELDIRTSELNQAKDIYSQVKKGARSEDKAALLGQLNMAKADAGVQKGMLEDATMKSDIDGYVIEVLYKEGELVGAGMPVIIIRKDTEVVSVGVSQEDIGKIQYGIKANIKINDVETTGEVTNIGQSPDTQTRTYNVEITLRDSKFDLGSVAKVEIIVGMAKGVWIPIASILSSAKDYVYIINDDIAERRTVKIITSKGSNVMVEGISPGENLVIEGMQKIKDKDKVTIQ